MKLRIKGDSLRLRLTQSEVRELGENGMVCESVHFAAQSKLEYRLRRDAGVAHLSASYGADRLEVAIPEAQALSWCTGSEVTLEHIVRRADGELRIVIEKDFSCLIPRDGEDESDHFAHPKAGTQQC